MRKVVLVVMLAACSDDGVRHTPDATPHDGPATPDAAVDAAPTPVTITTTRDGQPIGGVHVYFQNADSSVVLATVTDASGNASAVMAAGGYVTAVNPYTPLAVGRTNDELDTFVGVKPGDHLRLASNVTSTAINMTVTVPTDASAVSYQAFTSCGSTVLTSPGSGASPTGTISLYNCGTSTDFLVVTFDQAGVALDSFFVPATAIADQGTLDFTAKTYAAVPTRTYTYNNPGTLSFFSFTDSLLDATGQIYSFNGNTGSSNTISYAVPAFTGAGDVVLTQLNENRDVQTFADWGPYSSAYATDVGARLLTPLTSSPSFDPTTHTLSFMVDTTGATPEFVFGSVDAFRAADARGWTWRIAAPYGTSVVYPQLPTTLYDYNITANDAPANEQLTYGTVTGGYDAVRPFLLANSATPQADQFVSTTPGSATLVRYALLVRGTARKGDTIGLHAARPTPRVLSHRVQ